MTEEMEVMERQQEAEILPRRVGRPSKYDEWLTEDGLAQVTQWAKDGLFMEQIAKNMGITVTTLNDWRNKFPAISAAVKDGRAVVDKVVENAMFKRATGYQFAEETYERDENGDLVVTKRVVKTEAPNTAAQIFWMKNRRPEEYKDKVEVDNNVSGTIKIELGEHDKWSE